MSKPCGTWYLVLPDRRSERYCYWLLRFWFLPSCWYPISFSYSINHFVHIHTRPASLISLLVEIYSIKVYPLAYLIHFTFIISSSFLKMVRPIWHSPTSSVCFPARNDSNRMKFLYTEISFQPVSKKNCFKHLRDQSWIYCRCCLSFETNTRYRENPTTLCFLLPPTRHLLVF